NIDHLSASPLGAGIVCKSTLTAFDGRRLDFEVEVFDNAGLIGKGTHTRFTVKADSFLKKANAKLEK
ncbi:MAG: thioesterase, partial [Ruminococcus sp.]|nr:thioesterase [Ruminococcus sp.]